MPCLAFAPSAHFLSSCFSHSFAQPIHAINSSRDKNSRHSFANIACLIYALSAQFDERPNFFGRSFFCEKFSHSFAQPIAQAAHRQKQQAFAYCLIPCLLSQFLRTIVRMLSKQTRAKNPTAISHARLLGGACYARKRKILIRRIPMLLRFSE